MDQRRELLEAEKRLLEPHSAQAIARRVGLGFFRLPFLLLIWECFDFLAFLSSFLFGTLGFRVRSAFLVTRLICCPMNYTCASLLLRFI